LGGGAIGLGRKGQRELQKNRKITPIPTEITTKGKSLGKKKGKDIKKGNCKGRKKRPASEVWGKKLENLSCGEKKDPDLQGGKERL